MDMLQTGLQDVVGILIRELTGKRWKRSSVYSTSSVVCVINLEILESMIMFHRLSFCKLSQMNKVFSSQNKICRTYKNALTTLVWNSAIDVENNNCIVLNKCRLKQIP